MQRILRLSEEYRAHGKELEKRLPQVLGLPGRWRWAAVPPIDERARIVHDTHTSMGHTGRHRLLHDVSMTWWWPKMRQTVEEVLRSCPVCQADKAGGPPREPYRPAHRASLPGRGWSVDLAGPFPRDEEGNRYLAVAVDCLTKWVEARPIPSKHAFRTAEWMYQDVLGRWGKPDWIRTDNGTEWDGQFAELL